jgi:hypothetical protein
LADRALVQEIAESGDPVFAVVGRLAQHRIGDAGPGKSFELGIAAQFFDAEVERIDLVRVDQDRRNPGAAEHRGSGRTGQAAANDRDVGMLHGRFRPERASFAPQKGKKGLAWASAGRPEAGKENNSIYYPDKISLESPVGAAHVAGCAKRFSRLVVAHETSKLQMP